MRQLKIEPFKIFPNKTLCQLIRHRRNDASWATDGTVKTEVKREDAGASTSSAPTTATVDAGADADVAAVPPEEDSLQDITPTPYNESIARDLVSCFGIGHAKVKEGGFAWEALTVLNRPKVTALLEQSRKSAIKSEPAESV